MQVAREVRNISASKKRLMGDGRRACPRAQCPFALGRPTKHGHASKSCFALTTALEHRMLRRITITVPGCAGCCRSPKGMAGHRPLRLRGECRSCGPLARQAAGSLAGGSKLSPEHLVHVCLRDAWYYTHGSTPAQTVRARSYIFKLVSPPLSCSPPVSRPPLRLTVRPTLCDLQWYYC